ncbi:uncharacterized protein LOC115951578 [Quercus lobata]|uniref:uncharacterized protein LOC115951578 n=1 Tax=Quercus lobata TaxID=97700 RepID=UPI001244E153|nr:uncharacterized protein LOC115951578 [Quercus lobata]
MTKFRYNEFSAVQPAAIPPQPRSHVFWQPPSTDLFKINYDGATFDSENKSGIGFVIRDSCGLAIASLSQQVPRVYQAAEIEAFAATRALELFATEIGIANVVLEGDSWLIFQALSAEVQSLSPIGLLIEDVKVFYQLINYFNLIQREKSIKLPIV